MNNFSTFSYTRADLARMPRRSQKSNKGTFGRVLCVCGSRGMAGAACFAAKAAYRTGAGLVEILTPECNLAVLQTLVPEAVVTVYSEQEPSAEVIDAAVGRADAIVCGCGLGVGQTSRFVLGRVLRGAGVPCVIDADGLNLISRNPSLYKYMKGKIITPHPAEMSRLCGTPVDAVCADLQNTCHGFAARYELVCVLKDHRTAISDGSTRVYVNTSGNSGMATGGSGDVLSGIIGGILAQNKDGKLSAFECACLGVYIHGLSGDAAASALGEYSLMASDIIDYLPAVLKG